jgi:hypothetical protein
MQSQEYGGEASGQEKYAAMARALKAASDQCPQVRSTC